MIDILVPLEQEGTQAVVRAWLRKVGDRIQENDPLVELETDKVAVEVPAPAAGILREILLQSDAEAVPGAVLGRIAPIGEVIGHEEEAPAAPAPVSVEASPSPSSARARLDPELRLSPAVKRALLQHEIDP